MKRSVSRVRVTAANTQESIPLLENLRRVRAWPVNTPHSMQFSFTDGDVSSGEGFTASSTTPWDSGYIELSTQPTLYFLAPLAGMVFVVEAFTP